MALEAAAKPKRVYEAMFLVDSGQAASDWEGTMGAIENILRRAEAEVVAQRKWSERKLAYDVEHKSRGTYILYFFKADPLRIGGIERDVQLSDKILRVLVLGTQDRPQDILERDIAGQTAPPPSDEIVPRPPDAERKTSESRPAPVEAAPAAEWTEPEEEPTVE